MKNVSLWLLLNLVIISGAQQLKKSSAPNIHSEMTNRQPKFYAPILAFLLANLINPITAKYAPGAISFNYDPQPSPWIGYKPIIRNHHHQKYPSYQKPQNSYNYAYQDYQSWDQWQPANNPATNPASIPGNIPSNIPSNIPGNNPANYVPQQVYPMLTTSAPQVHHHHIFNQPPVTQQQIVTIHEHPAEIDIEDQYPEEENINNESNTPEIPSINDLDESPTIETPIQTRTDVEPTIAAESNVKERWLRPPKNFYDSKVRLQISKSEKRNSQRYSNKRRKNNKRKRYQTTTADYYDDSYEDYTTKKSRRKNPTRRPVDEYEDFDSSEEDAEYDESYEYPTRRPFNKRRRSTTRRTTNKRNKNKKRPVSFYDYDEDDYDDLDYKKDPVTDIIDVRQRQATTTTTETTTTAIVNGSTVAPTTNTTGNTSSTNTTGYGYGPSNGNEGISITYGPPTGGNQIYGPPRPSYGAPYYPQYQAQYTDWYDNDSNQNAIVQRVHDLLGIDNFPGSNFT